MSLLSLIGAEGADIYSFEDYKNGPEHRRLSERLRKTLYYGKSPTTDRPSYPMTQIAVEFFQGAAPKQFGLIDESFASFASRRSCMSPCSLMLAMLYIKRLKHRNPEYLQQVSSSDLFLISAMMASKYLYDEGADEEVFNDEWAESANLDIDELGQLERGFLSAIDWRLFVQPFEFQNLLKILEKRIAMNKGLERGWFSYTDLAVLTEDLNWVKLCYELCHEIWKVMVTCSMAYVASVITILGSTAFVLSMRNILTLTITQTNVAVPPVLSNRDLRRSDPGPSVLNDDSVADDFLDGDVSVSNINFHPWLRNFETASAYGDRKVVCACQKQSRDSRISTDYGSRLIGDNRLKACDTNVVSKRSNNSTTNAMTIGERTAPAFQDCALTGNSMGIIKSSCRLSMESTRQTMLHLSAIPIG
ncbi:protein CNPPD1-like [Tubulanus polymorphus]|uniref:protein CNPPD1-like n=1 Tax=Tubulanus polymorphus TaxID=672921 RepID=UPI003DA4C271